MTVPDPKLLRAKGEAVLAKDRLMATVHEVQERLAPKTIARNAWEGVRDKGEAVAEQTVDLARRKPALPIAAGGAIVAFAVRRPVGRLLGRIFGRKPKPDAKAKAKAKADDAQLRLPGQEKTK